MSNAASRDRVLCRFYILLFTLSGLAGLIYESVWTHYLKLFLGHAAYAQTLVLGIFMGGMAVGAWAASRVSGRIRNLLVAYAAAEALIGVTAIFFHPVFVAATQFSYDSVIPGLASPALIGLYKWTLGAVLILPQSVVLGATFPLMSAGIIRRFPRSPGRVLATTYFANSLGAAAGVLISGFVLIAAVGLPGTMLVAGVINCVVAGVVWHLSRRDAAEPSASVAATPVGPDRRSRLLGIFLLCAAVTGAASFMYEIAWIRMLSLVLGSSTHAFELMLSAFILGLALGGAVIRRSIDTITRPILFLAGVQVVMGVLAMISILAYGLTFDMMGGAIHALAPTDSGYALFNLFSHGLCLLVMLPTTVCAGMTLPLITAYLFTRGVGEASIGRVYAANTVGAIAGIILAMQLLMPWLGVRNLVIVGGTLDIALGIGLLLCDRPAIRRATVQWVTAAAVIFIATAVAFFDLDPRRLASGVYRRGLATLGEDSEVLFHRDGRTATIDRVRLGDRIFLATNGKPDAALHVSPTGHTLDENTMTLIGALPLGSHPSARTAAVIGMGSGMTTHTLLNTPQLVTVDTIEIEPAMVEAARGLGDKVANAFKDPRSRIHIADAKTFFAGHRKRYDLIISEPSNPWVSGVSGLFSVEFYDLVRCHLADDGLLAQWIHLYEIDMPLVASVMKAIGRSFDDYAVYGVSEADILVLASVEGPVPEVDPRVFEPPALRAQLDSIGIRTLRDLALAKLGTRETLEPFMETFPIGANSDYYPALDLGAVRARYLHRNAFELYQLGPLTALFDPAFAGRGRHDDAMQVSHDHPLASRFAGLAQQADAIHQYFAWKHGDRGEPDIELRPETLTLVRTIRSIHGQCGRRELDAAWLPSLHGLAAWTLPFLSGEQMAVIWRDIESADCFDELSVGARMQLEMLEAIAEADHELVASLADRILASEHGAAGRGTSMVLLAAMASHLALEDPEAALALWHHHVDGSRDDVRVRWIAAHAAQQAAWQLERFVGSPSPEYPPNRIER
jgi:predicted membrane-bound spermidine synthase